ncbi:hypothetical protein Q4603_02480 [Zobellia galactanivorans]|uniref:Conserved hypothetical periplasmic protein n=1 Tax=Zobellia galactanivorans (strain DSM 12802 / CCUG 47099 / CIP 106680 / NCIMB 13871 / Dsij) TaxID=63186 RepID=G0L800_ZOBGA|nr:hypothetical protein [Zobellia galactanivorans]MBU3024345.1 hypothetical protein [Zobellia galactanivorans]MDO6807452.1 hypothetical protein [Zobellia galactanivorans]CAZ97834.1 Conserved hypothetical periplasmic protein [Zobellia galactanivorans]
MKRFFLIGCIFLFLGCSSRVSVDDLGKLNGYWEITRVTFADGNTKEYKVNTSVDYIKIEDRKGFRKKVHPKLNGTFETSDDAESFTVVEEEKGLSIQYKTELSEWSELLTELDDDAFSVVNPEGIRYDYKRFEPISIQ